MPIRISHIFSLLLVISSATASAQRFGVGPLNTTDCEMLQFNGQVNEVNEQTYQIDYSRHTIQKGTFVSSRKICFFQNGDVNNEMSYDQTGELLSKTIYQYKDSLKSVSTTYNTLGERTLQTLYANTADGVVARMRYTDAIGVTISTSEISHKTNWSAINETFNDGEKVLTEYFYNVNKRLTKISMTSNGNVAERIFTLDTDGNIKKEQTKENGKRVTYEYEYTLDSQKNWIRRIASKNGTPIEITERTIIYY